MRPGEGDHLALMGDRSLVCQLRKATFAEQGRGDIDPLTFLATGAEDLAHRACELAGGLLELADAAPAREGYARARACLESGRAWAKFQRICEAQGGMRAPPVARFQQDMIAPYSGRLVSIDNRKLATVAKLAGAPMAKAAGVALQCRLNQMVDAGAPLCTIHAESPGELDYAAAYAVSDGPIFGIEAL